MNESIGEVLCMLLECLDLPGLQTGIAGFVIHS